MDSQGCELRREDFFPNTPNSLPRPPHLSLRPTVFFPTLTMEEGENQEEETKEQGHRDPNENIHMLCRQVWGTGKVEPDYQQRAFMEHLLHTPCLLGACHVHTYV